MEIAERFMFGLLLKAGLRGASTTCSGQLGPTSAQLVPWPPRWGCESHTVPGSGSWHCGSQPLLPTTAHSLPCLASPALSTQSTQDLSDDCHTSLKPQKTLRAQLNPCVCLTLWILNKRPQGKMVARADPNFLNKDNFERFL